MKQCDITWAHYSPISSCTTAPPSLLELSRDDVKITTKSSIPNTSVKAPASGIGEAGRPASPEQNSVKAAAHAAIQQLTKPLPQHWQ